MLIYLKKNCKNTSPLWKGTVLPQLVFCRVATLWNLHYRPDMSPLAWSPCSDPRFSLTDSHESSCSDHYGWTSHQRWRRWFQKRMNDCLGPLAPQTLKPKRRKHTVSQPPALLLWGTWPKVFQNRASKGCKIIVRFLSVEDYRHINKVLFIMDKGFFI